MSNKTIIIKNQNIEAIDIPTMSKMSIEDYKQYIQSGLFFIDHHGILRSTPADYPIACNKKQIDALIEYLKQIKTKIED